MSIPIKNEEELDKINDYFDNLEVELALQYESGKKINRDFLDDVAHAFDDTALCDDDDYVDIDELNEKLEQYASNHKQDRCKEPMQSSKGSPLRGSPPLGTVLDSFPSYVSSRQ